LLKQNRVAVFGCMDRPERNIDELPESVTADVFLGVALAGVNKLVVIGLFYRVPVNASLGGTLFRCPILRTAASRSPEGGSRDMPLFCVWRNNKRDARSETDGAECAEKNPSAHTTGFDRVGSPSEKR
jgi:hypothetical protein